MPAFRRVTVACIIFSLLDEHKFGFVWYLPSVQSNEKLKFSIPCKCISFVHSFSLSIRKHTVNLKKHITHTFTHKRLQEILLKKIFQNFHLSMTKRANVSHTTTPTWNRVFLSPKGKLSEKTAIPTTPCKYQPYPVATLIYFSEKSERLFVIHWINYRDWPWQLRQLPFPSNSARI